MTAPTPAPPARLSIDPPLAPSGRAVLASLAGAGAAHRIWTGQPGVRSPWRPCDDGCCLVLESPTEHDAVAWLRFLVREVLAPRAAPARRRAAALGLGPAHRVEGDALLETALGSHRLRVVGGRVTVRPAHDRVAASSRPVPRRGEVVQREPPGEPTRGPSS